MTSVPLVAAATAVRLGDGRVIDLRPLVARDAEAVAALHESLSDHDRYLRFFTLSDVGLERLVTQLTEPSAGRVAVGAFDGDRLVGVANYVVSTDPAAADIAIVVAHEYHSLGVGTALLADLARLGVANGVRRFIADVLAENHLMLQVVSDLGWECELPPDGSVRHLEIALPAAGRPHTTSRRMT